MIIIQIRSLFYFVIAATAYVISKMVTLKLFPEANYKILVELTVVIVICVVFDYFGKYITWLDRSINKWFAFILLIAIVYLIQAILTNYVSIL